MRPEPSGEAGGAAPRSPSVAHPVAAGWLARPSVTGRRSACGLMESFGARDVLSPTSEESSHPGHEYGCWVHLCYVVLLVSLLPAGESFHALSSKRKKNVKTQLRLNLILNTKLNLILCSCRQPSGHPTRPHQPNPAVVILVQSLAKPFR